MDETVLHCDDSISWAVACRWYQTHNQAYGITDWKVTLTSYLSSKNKILGKPNTKYLKKFRKSDCFTIMNLESSKFYIMVILFYFFGKAGRVTEGSH